MKKIISCFILIFCFSSSLFANVPVTSIKDLKLLEKKYFEEYNKQNYPKAIELSIKLIDLAKMKNEPSFVSIHSKNLGEIYLYKTKEYEKAWNAFSESSTYYNPISFMRLSEMAYNGYYVEKDPAFAIVLLGMSMDCLRVDRNHKYWTSKMNDNDEVGDVLINLTQSINNIYTQNEKAILAKSSFELNSILSMGYMYELCIIGEKDKNLCDTETALNFYSKAGHMNNEYLSKYAIYKFQDLLLRLNSDLYAIEAKENIDVDTKRIHLLKLMSDMSRSDVPLALVSAGLQYEVFKDYDTAKELYKRAFENGLIDQSYDLFLKIESKR